MTWHALLTWGALAGCVVCIGAVVAARALAGHQRLGLFMAERPRATAPGVRAWVTVARRAGAIAILLMLASRCAGSH